MEPLAKPRCEICEQRLRADGTCPNPVCGFDPRFFDFVWAIAVRSGKWEKAINSYKFDGFKGWATIFGRVLVGYLDSDQDTFSRFDMIVGTPTYTGAGATRNWDHIGLILERAAIEDPLWPWDVYEETPAIIQTKPTRAFSTLKSWHERYDEARGALRNALLVPDASRVERKDILVFDDVFTEGHRTYEVARALRRAGAASVSQIVLARQPPPKKWSMGNQ